MVAMVPKKIDRSEKHGGAQQGIEEGPFIKRQRLLTGSLLFDKLRKELHLFCVSVHSNSSMATVGLVQKFWLYPTCTCSNL